MRSPGPTPHPSSRRGSWLAGLVLVMVSAGVFWWGSRRVDGGPDQVSTATAQHRPSSTARSARRHQVPWSGGRRQPVNLGHAEVIEVDSTEIGALEGRVLCSSTAATVPGARLSFALGTALHAVAADDDGRFRLAPPREGIYELAVVTAEGYLPFAPEWGHSPLVFAATKGRSIRGATVYLTPAVSYRGVVVDPQGEPVAGATVVRLGVEPTEAKLASLPRTYRTDGDGQFLFHAADQTIFEARHQDFAPGRGKVGYSVQVSHQLVLRLRPAGHPTARRADITGTVVDGDGQGVPDALVVARAVVDRAAHASAQLIPGGRAIADETGAFALSDLDVGSYRLVASSPGFASVTARAVAAPREGLTLRLSRGGGLRGTVRDRASGAPVPAFTVVVSRRSGPLTMEVVAVESTFDSTGQYEIPALQEGSYRVTVAASDYGRPPELEVSIQDDTTATADFALDRGGRIVGQVLDGATAEPLEGARVSIESGYGSGAGALAVRASDTSDATGAFDLGGVSPGERTLMVAAAGHHGRLLGGLMVQEGGTIGPLRVELTPTEPDEEPRIELTGIGAVLGAKDDTLVIGRILEDGGAAEAGLVPGDAIVAVEGESVVDLGFQRTIDRIRGPEGTTVRLSLIREGSDEVVIITVPRRRIRG